MARVIDPLMIAALIFLLSPGLPATLSGAEYLDIHHVAGTGELAVLCGAAIGAGLGFLWLNASARLDLYAGDTGSLALGGMLGTVAVATKHEVVLVLICSLLVLDRPPARIRR